LDPRLDLFAWIRAHDMLDLRFLPYGTCQYHHMFTVSTKKNISMMKMKQNTLHEKALVVAVEAIRLVTT
jgi:hypothetical protein